MEDEAELRLDASASYHTHITIDPITAFAETYGKKSEEQDSFRKSEKRAEPKLVLIVNPEFTQHGILEANLLITAKQPQDSTTILRDFMPTI
ncbi:hypothetical protein E5288_WYG009097 [Bos mutus]|uniref:Uncharacterized protein n=1 Tax=Bos mutus TaxID=72004 RepID=A0A6B0QU93_9CETA|nr:hypothetical protein [Bos mutus]